MAFRFSLQPVLRLRESYERVERLRLLGLVALIVKVREAISALDRESASARRNMRDILAKGAAGAEMHWELACEKLRADQRRALQARLSDLARKQEKQRAVYLNARQKREILENLRDRKLAEYRREQNRLEQQAIDELFLIHRAGMDRD